MTTWGLLYLKGCDSMNLSKTTTGGDIMQENYGLIELDDMETIDINGGDSNLFLALVLDLLKELLSN
jgi:hypothetical protein